MIMINPLNTELNPICHLLALLGAHHILHVSRIRVKEFCDPHQIMTVKFLCLKLHHFSVQVWRWDSSKNTNVIV